jgi:hypothetical protein
MVSAVTQPYPGHPQVPTSPSGHPPQDYPPQGYPPQGHPPQGYPPQGYPPPDPGVNGFAVASLVLGIIGGILLSVIFGIVALVQMRRRPYRGKGMAIAGLVLSGVWVLGLATVIVLAIASEADRDSSGQVTGSGSVSTEKLRPGDCVNDLKDSDNVLSLPAVPCAQPHEGEVFATFTIPGATWPGDSQVQAAAERGCSDRLPGYAPTVDQESVELVYLHPTQRSWTQGDHGVTCIAVNPDGPTTGSLRG